MITSARQIRRRLARADQRDSAAFAAQVGPVWPERVFLVLNAKLPVPVAMDKRPDKMPVMICVTASGMNRSWGVAFSLC